MKIREAILPGALVRVVRGSPAYRLYAGDLMTVQGTQFYGAYLYFENHLGLWAADRFELIYNVPQDFNQEEYLNEGGGTC